MASAQGEIFSTTKETYGDAQLHVLNKGTCICGTWPHANHACRVTANLSSIKIIETSVTMQTSKLLKLQ